MPAAEKSVSSKLGQARRELLDLGLHNPLLNYRLLRSRGVEIVEGRPEEIFQALVRDGKSLSFQPTPERVEPATELPTFLEQPDENSANGWQDREAVSHAHLKLQTALSSSQLQTRLLNTYYAARTSIEEQGINILFLALGMLLWYEADNSSEIHRAPLILVPVELSRSNARERFRIRYTQEDVGENLSLAEKLRTEFAIKLPQMPDAEDLDVDKYLNDVAHAVRSQPRWSLDANSVVLGFFSFGKFLMYHDLDVSNWPEATKPDEHPIINALLYDDFREPEPPIGEEEQLDQHIAPQDAYNVVDADSSQVLALQYVKDGHNLVIQGPPGTGKSQTITNIIADAIGQGKSVLFVAEKMAALEVVKRRLDEVGLGEACLELHSHKTNKKAVLDELARTLDLGKPKLDEGTNELEALVDARDRLNSYCEALNTPIGESGVTPYQAFGELLKIQNSAAMPLPRIMLASLESWSGVELKRRQSMVEELQAHLGVLGVPKEHPFWGSRRTMILPSERSQLKSKLAAALDALERLMSVSSRLAEALGITSLETPSDAVRSFRAARRIMQAPDLQGAWLDAEEWVTSQDALRKSLTVGSMLADIHNQHDDLLLPGAWEQDVTEIRQNLVAYSKKWWRLLSSTYRSARNRLNRLFRSTPPRRVEEQLQVADAILKTQRLREMLNESESLCKRTFGSQWKGERSDWPSLAELLEWVVGLHQDVSDRRLLRSIVDSLSAGAPRATNLSEHVLNGEAALDSYFRSIKAVAEDLELDCRIRFGSNNGLESQAFTVQKEALLTWIERVDDFDSMIRFNVLAESCRQNDLGALVEAVESWPRADTDLVATFRYAWFESLVDRAFRERPALAQFDVVGQNRTVERFCSLDNWILKYNRARLAVAHWQRLPKYDAGGQLGILRREFGKKSRHLPIRRLMGEAGNVIQTLKPVFMMSPMSIAAYLPPGSLSFDLVVFDEASQVRPVDAFGAILRAKQAVVVGDSQQLPPTSFFDSIASGVEDYDEDNVTADIESILRLFVAQGCPQRMLRWHYRSRHESLIAVSNHEFYSDRLVVFPSPDAFKQENGLIYHHLSDTSYERGRSRTNVKEAKAVAEAVMAHARMRPEWTLGVVAFSVAQTNAILNQLELLRRQDPSCETFFTSHPREPFFVKNLENVQGDERDVILISIGYGRTEDGYIAMDFGPLNRDGGERRLNVLITRARRRCEVFTNLTADDIDLSRTKSRGAEVLKLFLSYAATGKLDIPVATGRGADSPFEEAVFASLTGLGYRVEQQVGSGGFWIDLAVVDPDQPGRYILGIECDGAKYHSARSARDRDRLRQKVLEGLNWRIHRIWSTDWYRHPEREIRRLIAAIEEAKLNAHTRKQEIQPRPSIEDSLLHREPNRHVQSNGTDVPKYQQARLVLDTGGLDLHLIPKEKLASWVTEVVKVEAPVHISEVQRRIAEAAGVRRIGNRIEMAMEAAFKYATRSGYIRRKEDFLWTVGSEQPVVRDRSVLPASARKIDLIPPEEISLAITQVVSDSFGMTPEEIPSAASRLLGFARVSEDMRSRIEAHIRKMVKDGQLAEHGNHLIANGDSHSVR